jgi:hypothetical protein
MEYAWLRVIVSKVALNTVNVFFCCKEPGLQNVLYLGYGGSNSICLEIVL